MMRCLPSSSSTCRFAGFASAPRIYAVKNGQPAAEICREVRGVVLSRQTVPVQQWAAALASALVSHAESSAQAAEALRRIVLGS